MVLQTRRMGFSGGQERMDRGTGDDVDLNTLGGANAPHACRSHQLPRTYARFSHTCKKTADPDSSVGVYH